MPYDIEYHIQCTIKVVLESTWDELALRIVREWFYLGTLTSCNMPTTHHKISPDVLVRINFGQNKS